MAEATIPVDLRNPGQVFACLGLMEAAEVLLGPAEGQYRWAEDEDRAEFTLAVEGAEADPVRAVLDFLAEATVEALTYSGATALKKSWGVVERGLKPPVSYVPLSRPDKEGVVKPNAASPIILRSGKREIVMSHWSDSPATGRNNAKFWAGSGGKPGATFASEALIPFQEAGPSDHYDDPFSFAAPQSSSFNFDWRRIATALDSGFSVDTQNGAVLAIGFPLVELLAALGLENARPTFTSRLSFSYGVSSARLPTILARTMMSGSLSAFSIRRFQAELAWLGPEDKSARAITDSREEPA